MNKKTTVAIGALVLFGLTACGSTTATPTATVTKVVTQPEIPATDSLGLDIAGLPDAIRAQDSWYNNVDDSTIIETATNICDALQRGSSIADIADIAATTIGTEHAPALIAGAIIYICPDQKYKVQ